MDKGYQVLSTDLIDRGFGTGGIDFLTTNQRFDGGVIITNPPFEHANQFVTTAINKISDGDWVCLFLRTLFLEGKIRKNYLSNIHLNMCMYHQAELLVKSQIIQVINPP